MKPEPQQPPKPPDEKGQVDFVRVLLEGYAQEILAPDEDSAILPQAGVAAPAERAGGEGKTL